MCLPSLSHVLLHLLDPRLSVVIWVPDENLLNVQPSQVAEQPDQVLRSLEAFVPEEWGLPPYDDIVAQQSRTE